MIMVLSLDPSKDHPDKIATPLFALITSSCSHIPERFGDTSAIDVASREEMQKYA